jgi:hypothetical protein
VGLRSLPNIGLIGFGTILDLCWPFYVHFYVHDETKLDLNHSIFIPVSNNLPQKVFGDLVIFFTDKID